MDREVSKSAGNGEVQLRSLTGEIMRRLFNLTLFLIFVFVAGCANPQIVPVRDARTRLEHRGYSILPPEGENWYSIKQAPGSVAFVKKMDDSPAHTFSTAVLAIPFTLRFNTPEEFKEFVVNRQKADANSPRFNVLEYNASLDSRFGPYTVRSYMKIEDREAKVSPVDTQFLIMEVTNYAFIHPDAPDLVINVQYSDRYKKGEGGNDPKVKEIGENFINGFQTTSLKQAPGK